MLGYVLQAQPQGGSAAKTPSGGMPRPRRRPPRASATRVLLVEDNPGDAVLVEQVLSTPPAPPFDLQVTGRLVDAERLLEGDPPDLVLLDLGLPDAQGLEALDRVLRRASGRTPIVVLTGSDDHRTATEAVQRGAQDYLSKDALLSSDHLVRSIRHSLERHRLLTEARHQERMALAAEIELRRLVEGNADGMVVIDGHGTVLYANRAAEELTGAPAGRLLGGPVPLPEGWEDMGQVRVGTPEPTTVVELRVAGIEWKGAPARIVSLRDVSERRAAETLRHRLVHADRLRSIGQLAAGVAHEVNNPAAFVTVNQEALAGELDHLHRATVAICDLVRSWGEVPSRELASLIAELDPYETVLRARQLLDENRTGIDRITAIARSLRQFARTDNGVEGRLDVAAIIDDACTMVRNEIRHRASLVKELGETPPVAGNRSRLTQVLVNLLVNATHALDETEPERNRITIRTTQREGTIRIEVLDTGRGIPQQELDRIFEPFFTTKGRDRGTGLGLALSAEIVRQHGGELEVQSRVGEGSCFTIVLPVSTEAVEPAAPSETPSADAIPTRARVLVIDDEPMLLRSLERILGAEHEVVTAAGGEGALRTLERDRAFDIVLCDLMMPEVDGVTVHRWLEQHAPHLSDRVVFMSGGAFTDRTRAFVARSDVRVVDKPVSVPALRALVAEVASKGDA
jgi:signal transduction histidine kinase/DNA-binding NarL/FixJ family response regulator